jgi:hypothetical protein
MKTIFALSIALFALHGGYALAEDAKPAAEAATIAEEKATSDTTLFTRVNGAYRKTEKQLKRES